MMAEDDGMQDRLDMTPDWQLKREIGLLKLLAKRIDMELRPRIHAWESRPDHGQGMTEDISGAGGGTVGTIAIGRDQPDRLEVTDPVAFGGWLAAHQVTMLGGMPAAVKRWVPESEATTQDFLERLVRNAGGELPPGVEVRRGRAATVTVRLERGVVTRAWTAQGIRDAVRLIMPPADPAGTAHDNDQDTNEGKVEQ